jgi:hypothetical protein
MRANRAIWLFEGVLLCTVLLVVAGCAPIVHVPDASESLPLQSVEEYERSEAIKMLDEVDTSNDPALESMVEEAKAELIEGEVFVGLPEETFIVPEDAIVLPENSVIVPESAIVDPAPSPETLPEGSFLMPYSAILLPENTIAGVLPQSATIVPEGSFVLPEDAIGGAENAIIQLLPDIAITVPENSILVPRTSAELLPFDPAAGIPAIKSPIIGRIYRGTNTIEMPAVGAILYDRLGTGYFETMCTATLIGCDTVLTAAHCLDENPQPQQLLFHLQNAGSIRISETITHPDYDPNSLPNADIALLRLAQPADGIRPEGINFDQRVEAGSQGMIVGFGHTGEGVDNPGLKRVGIVTTSSCSSPYSNENVICWNYQAQQSNTCSGDSGGPLFHPYLSERFVSGVTSAGAGNCAAGSSFDVRISRYSDWIRANSWSLETENCGQLPLVQYDALATFYGGGSKLSQDHGSDRIDFMIAPDTQLLRVTMNGVDPKSSNSIMTNNFDLYVRLNVPADRVNFDCVSANRWQYEACEIRNPQPGPWIAVVNRVNGEGDFQIIVTTFGSVQ